MNNITGQEEWLQRFDDRAEEAAILARQSIKIAACAKAASIILKHPEAERHKIKDSGNQVRHQTVPIEVDSGLQIVIGEIYQGERTSLLRKSYRAWATGGMSLMLYRQKVYSREIDTRGEADSQPIFGRPDTAILPTEGIKASGDPPDSIFGTFRAARDCENDIAIFSQHIALIANAWDIDLPAGNEFVGATRAVCVD